MVPVNDFSNIFLNH